MKPALHRSGRRLTIIAGCAIYMIGVIIQIAESSGLGLIVAGRLIAGFGVGFVSAIIIVYMSEMYVPLLAAASAYHCPSLTFLARNATHSCPKKVRGALVSGYQFCITVSTRSTRTTLPRTFAQSADSGGLSDRTASRLVRQLRRQGPSRLGLVPNSDRSVQRVTDSRVTIPVLTSSLQVSNSLGVSSSRLVCSSCRTRPVGMSSAAASRRLAPPSRVCVDSRATLPTSRRSSPRLSPTPSTSAR